MRGGTALALLGACAALFGASFAAAELTGDDEPERAKPAQPAAPAETPPAPPAGRTLALADAAGLPSLRERPKPQPTPSPAQAAPSPSPAPASPAPEPEPVSSSAP